MRSASTNIAASATLAALDNVTLSQADGNTPDITLAAGSPGEHGIGVAQCRFAEGGMSRGAASHHILMFSLGEPVRVNYRVGRQGLDHIATLGHMMVCPADHEFAAGSAYRCSSLVLTIPKEPLACICGERAISPASLRAGVSKPDGYLFGVARQLADEASNGFSSGPRYWADLTEALLDHLLDTCCFGEPRPERGTLAPETLGRINDYVYAHMGEPIDVDQLADVAVKGRSHFPRLFRQSVGVSPYQYLVRLRLKHAVQLMSSGDITLAEVAAATGFVDQSHLCRWVKRVYGTSPAQLAG